MSRKIFLIAGMHRSGTSYLTQTLSLLGLELPKSTQSGSPDNPKGHFESNNIVQYHDSLLNKIGLTWDSFISQPDNWFSSEKAEQAALDICTILESEYSGNSPLVLKDPRLSLFIPLWVDVGKKTGMQDLYIISFRHPFEVASSLERRNKIGKTRALLIWLKYQFDAENNSRHRKRTFVCFPQWAKDIDQTVDRIELDLGTKLPQKTRTNLVKAKREFEQDLVHYNESQTNIKNNEIERLSIDAFNCLLRLTIDPFETSALSDLDRYRNKFNELSHLFSEVLFELELKKENEMMLATTRANELQEQLTYSEGFKAEFKQKLMDSETLAVKLEQQLFHTQSHTAELEQRLEAATTSNLEFKNDINVQKSQNRSLINEHERLKLAYNKEKLTVVKPIYRNLYRNAGFILRRTFPHTWVDLVRKITPNPDEIPSSLTFKPQTSGKHIFPSELSTKITSDSSPDVFILSIINWDFRYQRPQHIAKGLAETGHRVFYIEMDLAESDPLLTMVSKNLYRVRLSSQDVGHIRPYTGQTKPEQTKNWITAFYNFCDAIGSTAYKQVIIQHPFWWQLAQHLPPEFQTLFDCMDDISGFSNTEQFTLDLEHDLLTKCDKLVVSSQYLFDKYKHYQTPTLIRNAAELSHFWGSEKSFTQPDFLKLHLPKTNLNSIKIGYVGAIAEWFDAELVKEVATKEINFEFHLCGAVTAQEPAKLNEVENIFLHGEIPYSDVPGFLHQMDVLIIPFKILPIIQACDPVKFYEYSAMGIPTVTTRLPELTRTSELTFFATTSSEFSEQIRNAYRKSKEDEFCNQLKNYASKNTWKHRTKLLEETLGKTQKVSIIILSYGDPNLTKASLYSLYDRGPSYPNMEVLIVDNGSSTKALSEIKTFANNYPNVVIIENGENLGFAKGNNVGLRAAKGDYIMLLNNDTVVAPGAINAMVQHLARNPEIGAVGPLTNNIGNEAKLFVEYEEMEQMKIIARQVTTGYRGIHTPISVVAYFATMFRRKDLKTFGLLSEDYGRGMFEDDDHCAVIKSKGYICALAEDAFIHHHLSATFSTLKDGEKEALFEVNKKTFEKRWETWKPHKYREKRPVSSLKV